MPRRSSFLLALLFLGFALLLRLTDLHDEPLDFNPVRQLRSAVIARGIYYAGSTDIDPQIQKTARNFGTSLPLYEPPILENIVAFGYRLTGGESIAIPRVLNTLFWLVSGAVLFLLGRQMASDWAILPGLAYFLFLPFSVYASRSFQPEASMVMWIILTVYAFYRWAGITDERRSSSGSDDVQRGALRNAVRDHAWMWAILIGVFGGMAALVKIVAAFFLGPVGVAAILYQPGNSPMQNFKAALRNPQVWMMGLLMVLPSAWYYLITIPQSSAEYVTAWTIFGEWTTAFNPSFYIRWMIFLEHNFGLTLIFLGLIGAFVAQPFDRTILLALWLGYFLHGVYFPRQTPTHDYYHIMLMPIVALSLAPLAQLLVEHLQKQAWWVKTASMMVLLLVSFYGAWIARSVLLGQNYAETPAYWQEVSEQLPPGRAVGYTQDFSLPMMYYGGRRIFLLPQKLTAEKFAADPEDADYFIITDMNQVDKDLVNYLDDQYPITAEGDGYVIYDLKP